MRLEAAILFSVLALGGCDGAAVSGRAEISGGKPFLDCVDLRDGERWRIAAKGVGDSYMTLSDSCVETTDTEGKRRDLCRSMAAYTKCTPSN